MTGWLTGLPDTHSFYKPDPNMLPKVDWRPPTAGMMPSWKNAKVIGVDLETKDEDLRAKGPGTLRKGNFVAGVSFAIEDGPEFYLPIRHDGGDNCNWDVMGYIREQFRDFKGVITGANLPYDLDWLRTEGVDWSGVGSFEDVQVTDVLINELHDEYNLDAICHRHDLPGKDEQILRETAAMHRVNPKTQLWRLPARFVAQYAMVDARRPTQIRRRQARLVEKEGIEKICKVEYAITPILVKMRRRGVRIDVPKLDFVDRKAYQIEAEMLAKVKHATGVDIGVGNVWKSEVLAHALTIAGYKVKKTDTGKSSVDKIFLDKCGEVGKWILHAREWNKLRTTFVKQVREALVGDRVHCSFHQLKNSDDEGQGRGVRYGRFSSSHFNVQQQPVRHEDFGTLWRSIFIKDEGSAGWACSDWSQQEPRIGVHYA